MSRKEEEQFRQMMADFARDQGERLLELEKSLPPLAEEETRRLFRAAQAQKQARQIFQSAQPSSLRPWRRHAAAAALVLLAGSTALWGEAGAVKDAVGCIQIRLTENGVSYALPQEEWGGEWEMKGRYAPAWLPEGYELMEQSKQEIEGFDSIAYVQTNHYQNGTILFQRFSTYAVTHITEDKESAQPVWVGENRGGLIAKEWYNSTDYRLTWYDPEAQSFFCLSTTYVPREEVFVIAESVQRID